MFANQVCFLNSSLAPPTSSTQGADRSWMLGQKAAQATIGSRTYHCTDERLSQKWLICSGCPAGSVMVTWTASWVLRGSWVIQKVKSYSPPRSKPNNCRAGLEPRLPNSLSKSYSLLKLLLDLKSPVFCCFWSSPQSVPWFP
jgi:hypothetical protein